MNDYEKYLYDLNGYLHVENALSPELVRAMNEAIDNNRDKINIRSAENSLDGRGENDGGRSSEGLKGTHGRGDFGSYLFWDEPWCRPFREAIALPRIMRLMLGMIGPRFRLEGNAGMTMDKGAEGFILHGGGQPEHDHMREVFFYRFENGRMSSGMISVSFNLAGAGPDDGGFVCIPGSHKANYPCPLDVKRLERDPGCVKPIPMKAGDAVIFTESLTHGTAPWTADHERRVLRYLYTPSLHVGNYNPQFDEIQDQLTPLQQAVVRPGYHPDADIAALIEAEEEA